jgi:Photosynthetic reaction centre cytochrome C subunit
MDTGHHYRRDLVVPAAPFADAVQRGGAVLLVVVAAVALAATTARPVAAQERPAYTNLHVLPGDISRSDLRDVMLSNLSGLGLSRRANEGCLFCHVGSMDVPSREWDWASDDNPMKPKARAMMGMVAEINDTWLAGIERTFDDEVGCHTCHAGRTNPMPLTEVLAQAFERDGVAGVIEAYRTLRIRYFAADAYDFRIGTLASVAQEIARSGRIEDAARVLELNIEYADVPAARHGLIRLRMVEALDSEGIEAMVARYHSLKRDHPADTFSPLLLSGLSWGLFRSGREDAGFRLFTLNFEEHPDAYVATEDLAWGNQSMGNHDRAIELAEAWVTEHPDHEFGLRLLADLREQGSR